MKDKTINIPVFEADNIKTVESLPRAPKKAGLIGVSLKRRLEYKKHTQATTCKSRKNTKNVGIAEESWKSSLSIV